jgi:hypothetical protein
LLSKVVNNEVVSTVVSATGTGTVVSLVNSNTGGTLTIAGLRAGTGIVLTTNADGTITIST